MFDSLLPVFHKDKFVVILPARSTERAFSCSHLLFIGYLQDFADSLNNSWR